MMDEKDVPDEVSTYSLFLENETIINLNNNYNKPQFIKELMIRE